MSSDYSLLKIVLIFTLLWVPINDAMARDSYIENCLRSVQPDGHCLRMQRNLKRWEDSIEIAANKAGIAPLRIILLAIVRLARRLNSFSKSPKALRSPPQ